MPKNKGAGGKNRKKGKKTNDITFQHQVRDMVYKTDGQEYAQILKSLGNGYMQVSCFINEEKVIKRAHIRGTMRKKIWLSVGDIVLVSKRDYQNEICDILFKYSPNEVHILQEKNEIPKDLMDNNNNNLDDNIVLFNDLSDDKHTILNQL